jgi:hypothetical protein
MESAAAGNEGRLEVVGRTEGREKEERSIHGCCCFMGNNLHQQLKIIQKLHYVNGDTFQTMADFGRL